MPRSENLLSQKSEGSCMKEVGGMDALIQYIRDYIRSHPDEYREWLKAKGQDEDGHEAHFQDRAPDFGRPEEAL